MLIRKLLISGTTNKPKSLMTTTVSHEEEAKFEGDWKELGWFMSANLYVLGKSNIYLTIYTRKIIVAKLNAKNYARSNGCGAKLLAKEYVKSATEHEEYLSRQFWFDCDLFFLFILATHI